ncbi:MAG: hypothetical protein U0U70_16810 [Chitinophagaceae bacterium]
MKEKPTPLVDEHLQSIAGMKQAETDAFFYTRLQARMNSGKGKQQDWGFRLKPVWVIGGLVLLLAMNGFMLLNDPGKGAAEKPASSTPLQSFASSFDQTITFSY